MNHCCHMFRMFEGVAEFSVPRPTVEMPISSELQEVHPPLSDSLFLSMHDCPLDDCVVATHCALHDGMVSILSPCS